MQKRGHYYIHYIHITLSSTFRFPFSPSLSLFFFRLSRIYLSINCYRLKEFLFRNKFPSTLKFILRPIIPSLRLFYEDERVIKIAKCLDSCVSGGRGGDPSAKGLISRRQRREDAWSELKKRKGRQEEEEIIFTRFVVL